MPRLYRTCFINSNLEVTYLCLALIEVIKFKNKNEVRTAIRKHHFDRALVGGECAICEVLWDLVVEYNVRHRLVRTFWEAAVVVAGLVGEEVSVAEVQVAAGKGFSIPLSESELRHLAKVIEELEGQTEGEIRLMLVGSSMVTGHLFRTLFGWILALCLLLVWLDRHHLIWASSFWLLAGVFVFAGVLAASLSRIPFFIRAFSFT
jgi:hypothetical protein